MSRKRVAPATTKRPAVALAPTFRVVYEPEDGEWCVRIPAVAGCQSEGRSLAEARRHIREALATCVDAFDDADAVAKAAVFIEEVRLPREAKRLVKTATDERRRAEERVAKAHTAAAEAARVLTRDLGFSLRDAGDLLGLSHERVKQLSA